MTCRLDVVELLEKRVKSRFSHRQIFLNPSDTTTEEGAKFEDRVNLFKDLLSLPQRKNVNKSNSKDDDVQFDAGFVTKWNKQVEALANNDKLLSSMKQLYRLDINERAFRYIIAMMVSSLSNGHPKLEANDFVEACKSYCKDDKVSKLEGLSILEMSLVNIWHCTH